MRAKTNAVKVLFIGNSHTYYNDMPQFVKMMAEEDGYDCTVTMLAHAGWYLSEHAEEPEVRFNILYGKYDYVVLQEHAHPFGPEEKFHEAAVALNDMIRHAGSIPVIFECWARKAEPEIQNHMNEVHKQVAAEIDALLAPVGEYWWPYMKSWPDLVMYAPDGEHASVAGSEFAAKYIWVTIRDNMARKALGMDCK